MDIIFCADKKVLPGLHVAARTLLERAGNDCLPMTIHLFSDILDSKDVDLLRSTLTPAGKDFELRLYRIDPSRFHDFPSLNGSWATYYRLHAATVIDAERFLYIDADTLCDTDITPLLELDFKGAPAAWVPEAPLARAVDRQVAEALGNSADEPYFNAGVILINGPEWKRQRISERSMEYVATESPAFHDQSGLNMVLHRNSVVLDERFNTIANMRRHWPTLLKGYGHTGRIIHFLDYPKPWDLLGECISPYHELWASAARNTALAGFRSWTGSPVTRIPRTRKALRGYGKALKDRFLFIALKKGLLRRVKGMD